MTITTTDGGTTTTGSSATSGNSSKTSAVTGRVKDAAGSVKNTASTAYSSTRERTSEAFSSARERASGTISSTKSQVEANPVVAIAGGLAIGAILGAVLPKTRREQELLGDVGHRVTDAARDAANSAVEAGREQVDELKNSALQKVGSAVVEAVTSSDKNQ